MKHLPVIVAAILLAMAPAATADSVDVLSGDSAWHPFEAPATSGGSAFWNNRSYDGGGECNIGYWLAGVGGCRAMSGHFYDSSPKVTPDYLGSADTRFGFARDGGTQSVTVTTKLGVTSWYPSNEFGWYLLGDTAQTFPLFGRFLPSEGTVAFIPSGNYGFYLASRQGTFFSGGSAGTTTHFSVFQLAGTGHYLMGSEDMWFGADFDYNDAVFDVQLNAVPEPASLLLLGAGLAGLGAAVRNRRRRSAG